jgi:hypothetical protein
VVPGPLSPVHGPPDVRCCLLPGGGLGLLLGGRLGFFADIRVTVDDLR